MNIRKIGITASVVTLLAVAIGFGVKMKFESDVRADVEKFLAALPQPMKANAEKIVVSFFDKSVILTNITFSYPIPLSTGDKEETLPLTFSAARVTAEGINMDGFAPGAGVAKLVDRLAIEKLVIDTSLTKLQIDQYNDHNISANFSLVISEFRKNIPLLIESGNISSEKTVNDETTQKAMRAIADILKAAETIHVGASSYTNYTYTMDVEGTKVDMLVQRGDSKDYSIRGGKSFAMNGLTVSVNGTKVATLDSSTIDEVILPSFIPLFEVLADDPMPHKIQSALKGQPFTINNLQMKNMRVNHPILQDRTMFALGNMNLSYVTEDAHTMNFAFNNMSFDKNMIAEAAELPAEVLALLPDTITFDGLIDQTVAIREGNIFDLDCQKIFFKGTGLGEATIALAVDNISPMAYALGVPNPAKLRLFDAKVSDQGFTNIFFAMEAHHNDISAEENRANEIESLRSQIDNEPGQPGREILEGLAKFLELPGGSLQIMVKPEQAVTVEQLMQAYAQNPTSLGVSVTFTPAK